MEQGDYPEAKACYEECLRLSQAIGPAPGVVVLLVVLGVLVLAWRLRISVRMGAACFGGIRLRSTG